ncbi:MAG: hypothetical protein AB7T31_03255 [Gemmatimonadales bacterium]
MPRIAIIALLVLGAACREESRDDREGDAAPSAESSAAGDPSDELACGSTASPRSGAPAGIDSIPCLSVGVLAGDPMEELDRVVTPFLLPDGSLAVPTSGASTIRIFSSDGAFERSLGGPGAGPGEFEYLASAWPRGDTIEAFDLAGQRILRFLPGDSVATLALGSAPAAAVYGPLGAGWATSRLRAHYGARDSMAVLAVSRSLEDPAAVVGPPERLSTPLTTAPGMHREVAPGISGPHPLSPTAVAAVHAAEVYVGETQTSILSVYAADGTLRRVIPLPLEPYEDAAGAMRQVIDSAIALADEDDRPDVRARWSSYRVPARLSVFWALIVDELGYLWVRPYDPIAHALALDGLPSNRGGPGGRWLVLTPEGTEVGWVDVPAGLEPAWITANAVVGVHRDELGVESVRVHRLRRR